MKMFIDHLIFIVEDIDRTEKFYSSFLNPPIRRTERSVVYGIGETKLFFKLPYRELTDLHERVSLSTSRDNTLGGLNHIAFGLTYATELDRYVEKLDQAGIIHSEIKTDTGSGKNYVWFDDPNGIRLEFFLRGEDRRLVTL